MKRAAVIGLGDIAPIHLAVLNSMPEVELCAVCDLDESTREKAPGVTFYSDYTQLLAGEKPDVVHICLPHYLHVPVAKACVLAGASVLCEKPVALTGKEAEDFAKFEAEHPEAKICICLQNRQNETVEALKGIIDSGEYGRVTGTGGFVFWQRSREYYSAKPWRGLWDEAGGGCMINQTVHTLDLLYYLGGKVKSLTGTASQLLDYGIEVEDSVMAHLQYENGATGIFTGTVAWFKNENVRLTVQLEKAEFTITDEVLYRTDGEKPEFVAENQRLPGTKFYYGASHDKLIRGFYHQLETGGDDYIHVRDAVESIRLIDAIQRSSTEKQMVSL